ncbi:GNAT family N-acetyltransferase [Nonomuraea sp. NBC_01738]|uniref:GNAT family N-acetyltransferase n=1 Tax=Nonomuraea sp. NBC_01738 TaxID=2976003 RepID=UPI002E1375F1|nr:GNAT family N-acetyltransferase [Nonomuraea sp. NBC_01738]
MLTRRHYTDDDLPRLQDTVSRWILETGRCGYDHIGELPHRIYENLRGHRLVHVWLDGTDLAGLTINRRFGEAFDAFVSPKLRGADAERTMIRDAAATTGGAALTDVPDCDTVRIALLEELGFTRFRVWDDLNEATLTGLPDFAAVDGFTLRSATLADAGQLAEARNAAFTDTWTGDLYRDEVMTKPGYDPAREIVAESADGRIAAFAVYWTDERNAIGHYEPVGTHPDFWRRGLARAVMLRGMREMAALGLRTVTVNHNAENAPARALYASLGFRKYGQTYGYRGSESSAKTAR